MKNKIINITLGILIVASVGVNVYQYNQNNSMRLKADSIQTEIDNANTNYISLSESISAKGEEITTLGNKIADLEDNLSNLQSTNSSLSTQIADLELTIAEKEKQEEKEPEPDTDGDPFDDNYIDQLVKEILAEQQPSGGSSSTAGSSTPEADAYVQEHSYGTYDSSQPLPGDNFGSGGAPEHLQGAVIQ